MARRYKSFNPDPDKPYSRCDTCGIELATEKDSRQHQRETLAAEETVFGERRSHTVSITNPTREQRIRSDIAGLVSEALNDLFEELEELLDTTDASVDEISNALGAYPDVLEAWQDTDE